MNEVSSLGPKVSAEHEILNAHKYKEYQEYNCWHFNIYEQEKFHAHLC